MNQCFETQQFGGLANLTMGRTGCIYISLSESLMPVERIRSGDHNLKYDRLLRKESNALFVGSTLLQLYETTEIGCVCNFEHFVISTNLRVHLHRVIKQYSKSSSLVLFFFEIKIMETRGCSQGWSQKILGGCCK